ncbi:hypothetical protein SMC26_21515 [Actinomadura fulvescens]|uniref:hypothetical protein n=1 Tax=Actinomadura fulvescens TaxID=46160 RepID=UPI0031E04573
MPGPTPLFAARRGDTLFPAPHLVSGDVHHEYGNPILEDSVHWPDGTEVTSALTRDGTTVPPRTDNGMTVYDLPQARARYELRLVYNSSRPGCDGYKVDTAWGFSSERPIAQNVPAGYVCGRDGTSGTGDCAATSTLLLDYDIPLDLLHNASPGPVTATISAHHQPGAAAPALTGLQASVSYDGGTTWQQATTTKKDDHTYTAALDFSGQAGKSVTLRVQAQDSGGNTVHQTIYKAFTVQN